MSRAGNEQNRADPKTHDRSSIPMTRPRFGASGLMALFETPGERHSEAVSLESIIIY
jgi:hypothetical protein